ncbi:MAG: cytochrome C oxidase subunit II, partial [Spirochaetaceae bacterium]|jgi:heme oxygenase|nr:cytochrome C oxidase subunit II [Spirochaetaceae bacterium]
MINPYHIQPGLLLDVDITSIKRKKATLDAMANVLNEFLHGVSKGFQDAAFASFSRRRSTVREDINQSFAENTAEEEAAAAAAGTSGQAYLDLLNSGDKATAQQAPALEAPKRGRGGARKASAAAAKPRKARKTRGSGGGSLKEL